MLNELYTSDASLYEIIAGGRNFSAQISFLLNHYSKGFKKGKVKVSRSLELFAGPAWHTKEIKKHNFEAFAIDASNEMRIIACNDGLLKKKYYYISRLPNIPRIITKLSFDLAFALCYSIGYLSPLQLRKMLNHLSKIIVPGGMLFLELHDLNLLRKNLDDLKIKERIIYCQKEKSIKCVWPSAPIEWSNEEWVVQMPILIEVREGRKLVNKKNLISKEYIHLPSDFKNIAEETKLWEFRELTNFKNSFLQSKICVMEKL